MNRLIAIGDIHGCYKTFYNLVTEILNPDISDRIILLGDYIDRGPDSREVIDFIISLGEAGYDIIPLAGNHESMLLAALESPSEMPVWMMNSGRNTLDSFGINHPAELDDKYLKFFYGLKYFHSEGEFLFSHAGFNDLVPDPFTDTFGMIWESRTSYTNPVFSGKRIIHGHRPKTLEYVRKAIAEKSQVIPVDTGCVYGKEMGYGYLSALDTGTMNLFSAERI